MTSADDASVTGIEECGYKETGKSLSDKTAKVINNPYIPILGDSQGPDN